MFKKIYAFSFVLFFLSNSLVCAVLKYDIFDARENLQVYWTDEGKHKLPREVNGKIAIFNNSGNESYILNIEENDVEHNANKKEQIGITFRLKLSTSEIDISVRDEETEETLKLKVRNDPLADLLTIDNQMQQHFSFDRDPSHPVSVIFTPKAENLVNLSFDVFEAKSKMIRTKKRKNTKKRRKTKIPLPPPPPPAKVVLDDLSSGSKSITSTKKDIQKKEIKHTDIPQLLFASGDLQTKIKSLKSARDRQLGPEPEDRNLDLERALKERIGSVREAFEGNDDDPTDSWSDDASFQSTCDTYSCMSVTSVRPLINNQLGQEDTDDEETEGFLDDEEDADGFIQLCNNESKCKKIKCYETKPRRPSYDDDEESTSPFFDANCALISIQNTSENKVMQPIQLMEHPKIIASEFDTKASKKPLLTKDQNAKKSGFAGKLMKVKSNIGRVLHGSKKENSKMSATSLQADRSKIVPSDGTTRRLSVTHMRGIFESPPSSDKNVRPKVLTRYSSEANLKPPSKTGLDIAPSPAPIGSRGFQQRPLPKPPLSALKLDKSKEVLDKNVVQSSGVNSNRFLMRQTSLIGLNTNAPKVAVGQKMVPNIIKPILPRSVSTMHLKPSVPEVVSDNNGISPLVTDGSKTLQKRTSVKELKSLFEFQATDSQLEESPRVKPVLSRSISERKLEHSSDVSTTPRGTVLISGGRAMTSKKSLIKPVVPGDYTHVSSKSLQKTHAGTQLKEKTD